jgi:hypothetical protein
VGSSLTTAQDCAKLPELGNTQKNGTSPALAVAAFLAFGLGLSSCGEPRTPKPDAAIQPVYDPATGRLQQLRLDSDKNGTVDTVSYMDGTRLIRIEVDKDEDGRVERWEYYGPERRLEKVGFSRANDGKEDAWSFNGPDGSVVRVDISTERDGRVTRTEHYENGVLTQAEDDDDRDGRSDRWETYDGGRLSSVAFDTTHRGTPDRRLVYGPDGAATFTRVP